MDHGWVYGSTALYESLLFWCTVFHECLQVYLLLAEWESERQGEDDDEQGGGKN